MNFISKIKNWAIGHKKSFIFIFLALSLFGYWIFGGFGGDDGKTRYVLATVERGAIIQTISGTGQVSASNQIDLSSKVSGDLIYLNAKVGQTVGMGALVGQIDANDAAFELESAKISYNKLLTVDPDDLSDARADVEDTHTEARTVIINSSSDFSDIIQTLNDIRNGYLGYKQNRNRAEEGYIDTVRESYKDANDAIDIFNEQYNKFGNKTANTDIETLAMNAYDTSLVLLQLAKDTKDAVVYLREHEDETDMAEADSAYTSISDVMISVSAIVGDLSSARNAMKDANLALKDIEDGPDTLDLRSEELALSQKEQAFADYFIRAPFEGVIASVPVQSGDSVSNGTTIATIITKQKVAEISLNEVDVAKIKVGQKSTITFDATEDLTITGEVIEIDLIGTVSQGVVSYNVRIGFDTNDDRVKPGMTANAAIIIDVHQDILFVPASAVKTQNGLSFVQIFNPALVGVGGKEGVVSIVAPQQVEVEIGISDDLNVEILSGLEEGEQIVTRVISGAAAASTSTAGSGGGFNAPRIRL